MLPENTEHRTITCALVAEFFRRDRRRAAFKVTTVPDFLIRRLVPDGSLLEMLRFRACVLVYQVSDLRAHLDTESVVREVLVAGSLAAKAKAAWLEQGPVIVAVVPPYWQRLRVSMDFPCCRLWAFKWAHETGVMAKASTRLRIWDMLTCVNRYIAGTWDPWP